MANEVDFITRLRVFVSLVTSDFERPNSKQTPTMSVLEAEIISLTKIFRLVAYAFALIFIPKIGQSFRVFLG